jgi:hypothetical protein
MDCPKCKKNECVKAGFVKTRQRYDSTGQLYNLSNRCQAVQKSDRQMQRYC